MLQAAISQPPSVATVALTNVPEGYGPVVHVLHNAGTLNVNQSKLTYTPMFAPGTWKNPGQRPPIWQTLV